MKPKYLAGLVPLLAAIAFAAAPTMAQASTGTEYGVVEGGVFHAFTETTPVVSEGTSNFVLRTSEGLTIVCATFEDEGKVENVGGIGKSKLIQTLGDCVVANGGVAGCDMANIEDTVEGEVEPGGVAVRTFNLKGFNLEVDGEPSGCPVTDLGQVTLANAVVGAQAEGSNVLVFSNATGIEWLGEAMTISGSYETLTEQKGEKQVVIG